MRWHLPLLALVLLWASPPLTRQDAAPTAPCGGVRQAPVGAVRSLARPQGGDGSGLRLRGGRGSSSDNEESSDDDDGGGGRGGGSSSSEERTASPASRKRKRSPSSTPTSPKARGKHGRMQPAPEKESAKAGGEKESTEARLALLQQAIGPAGQLGRRGEVREDMVLAVESLRGAIARGDKDKQRVLLKRVANLARKQHAPGIFKVPTLKTDGLAVGGSVRQRMLQRSTSAQTTNVVEYDGQGQALEEIRERSQVLSIPNPTDDVLGIDELTELRVALEKANETRTIPASVRTNRDLAKYAKAAIGDLIVTDDVAVKWWLVKKREKAAQKEAYMRAQREVMIKHYATMCYIMAKRRAEAKGIVFNPAAAEAQALADARYHYEIEPIKQQREVEREALKAGVQLAPAIVKPKGTKKTKMMPRRGPRRNLNKKPKVIKVIGGKKRNKKDGTGSQRKKRSGLSGGQNGKSRYKKRKGL